MSRSTGDTKTVGQRVGDLGRRLLASRGFRLERVPRPLLHQSEAELRMSLDYVLARRCMLTDDFFFVQIGAYDGRRYDPIFAWVNAHRWRGVLVEPQPRYFSALVDNYKGVDGLEFRRVAVGARNEMRPFHTVAVGPDVSPDAGMLASFDRSTLLSHRRFVPGLESLIRTEQIECVALNDLLEDVDATHIDLLQIDVEGYDHELLRVLDIERFTPSIVRFEHLHLTTAQHEASIEKLIAHDYRVCLEEHDTLAFRLTDLSPPDDRS